MSYIIIENKIDLENVKDNLLNTCLIFIVPLTFDVHPVCSKASIIFLNNIDSDTFYVIPIDHSDFESDIKIEDVKECLSDVNLLSIDCKKDFHILGIYPSIDINILSYISTLEVLDISSTYLNKFYNFYRNSFNKLTIPNCFVPSNFYMELFETISEFSKSIYSEHKDCIDRMDYVGTFEINKFLCRIEQPGIAVDIDSFKQSFDSKLWSNVKDGKVFSEYSVFTSTGRPSNKFGGINFAALSKKDDTRKSFVSRFGDNGLLVDIDFQACHPHLIAKLIGYTIPNDLNIYEYLGRFYFNKQNLSFEEIEKSKSLTFRQLYGHVDKQFQSIPYFKKKIEYNENMVSFFRKNGYIETPLFKRRMDSKNFGEENAEKMFAYLLQSYETEENLLKSRKILKRLNGFSSELVLYTYDSFLIDFCKDDPKTLITDIKSDLEDDNMPVSIKVGNNYKDLKKITI